LNRGSLFLASRVGAGTHRREFVESDLSAILFASTARQEPAIMDGDYKGIEKLLVSAIVAAAFY
jgi:hypothetical protein